MYYVYVANSFEVVDGEKVPDPVARKYTIAHNIETEKEAQQIVRDYDADHPDPGPLSRHAYYDDQTHATRRR